MILYFTATDNSLYAAKQLDTELVSIPQELNRSDRRYKADAIGIVCPLFELDMPPVVRTFIRDSQFETDYFYIILTYGCHHGGVAQRVQADLQAMGKPADYINTVLMLDNALPVFDMDAQRQLEPEKQVDAHLAALRADIDARKRAVQPASDWEKEFYAGYRHMIEEQGPYYVQPLYRVTGDCIGCGTCTRVCPMGCISLRDGRPAYQTDRCVGCMACIHACPQKAVQFASLHEVNPNARYRNPHIPLAELIRANRQP